MKKTKCVTGTTGKENWFDYFFFYSYAKFYIQFDFELVINLENVNIGIFTAIIICHFVLLLLYFVFLLLNYSIINYI